MSRAFVVTLVALLVLSSGCGLPPKLTLADINPVRAYNVDKEPLFDAVRQYSTKESYKVERFEMESGSIKAHKVLATRTSGPGRNPTAETRHVVMNLKVKDLTAGVVELTASFGYVDYQGSFSSEDEGYLVSEYTNLFSFLEDQLKK